MSHAKQNHVLETVSSPFRAKLATEQPEVLVWLEQHLAGATQDAGVELAARYFETTERWGDKVPSLKRARLNTELQEQMVSIEPGKRWIMNMPITIKGGDKRTLGKVLQALVSVSQVA